MDFDQVQRSGKTLLEFHQIHSGVLIPRLECNNKFVIIISVSNNQQKF